MHCTVRGCNDSKLHKNSKKSGDGLPTNPGVSDEKDSGTSFEIKNNYYFLLGRYLITVNYCAART